jgi:flagellar hook-associated protein 3 FlgL
VSVNGIYVFAGTNTRTKPFIDDPATSSGIRYDGNDGVSSVPIGETRSISMNVPGNKIFSSAGADVFKSLQNLASSLRSNDSVAISAATSEVRTAFDRVTGQRVFYGNAISQMESDENYLADNKLELARQGNQIAGIDPIEAISRFVNAQAAHEATLQAAAKVSRLSLLDYIR